LQVVYVWHCPLLQNVPIGALRVAAAIVMAVTVAGCEKRNECKATLPVVRGLDSGELDMQTNNPSDVGPLASYFEHLQKSLHTVQPSLHQDSVRAWASNVDGLLGRRIQLLQSATFDPPVPSASPGMSREQILQMEAQAAVQQLLQPRSFPNSNEAALDENRKALHQAHDAYFNVCQ
jgi:hypothetical protein